VNPAPTARLTSTADGYGKIRSALEISTGGKVNRRFLAAVVLRVK
jgi:hypothetical protein